MSDIDACKSPNDGSKILTVTAILLQNTQFRMSRKRKRKERSKRTKYKRTKKTSHPQSAGPATSTLRRRNQG